MEIIQSSILGRILLPVWSWFSQYYRYSLTAKIIRSIAEMWHRFCQGSLVIGFLTREGALSRAWSSSMLCRILMFVINIPTSVLRWIYQKLSPAAESSVAAQLVVSAFEETPLMVGWLMLLFMVIPYESWNNAYSFMGFILAAMMAVAAGMRKKTYRLEVRAMGPWLTAYWAFVLVAFPLSAYMALSKRFLIYYMTSLLCVVVIVSTVRKKEHLIRLMECSCGGMLVMSAYAFVQRIQGVEVNPSFVDQTVNAGMPGRVFSFYENPNAFGEVLLMLIPLAVALIICGNRWRDRTLGAVSLVAGLGAIAMTYSRADWVGLAFAAFLFVLLWKSFLIPVFILGCFAGACFLPDTVFHRILTIVNMSDTSTNSRFPLYKAAYGLLTQRPVLGAGLGSDAVRQAVHDLNLFHGHDHFVHCHDIYLQIWCETGLAGLITFVGSIFWTLKKGACAVARKTCHAQIRLPIIGSVSAIMGAMVCGIADYVWNYPRVMLIFWFVFAIGLAGIRLAGEQEETVSLEEQ